MATDSEQAAAYGRLVDWFRPYSRIYTAFSGGADSALVLQAAVAGAGKSRVCAVTADSASLPRAELAQIERLVSSAGVEWIVLKTDELNNPLYRANAGDRCYHCKQALYSAIDSLAREQIGKTAGVVIVDGTNTSDLGDDRPGLRAAAEHEVRHPLVEAGFDKAMVRLVSRELGLATADKPAMACLSSRLPVGTEVSSERLSQIEQAESALRELGFLQLRVRFHELVGGKKILARIELNPQELARATDPQLRSAVLAAVASAGFDLVTLDLAGYSSPAGDDLVGLPASAEKLKRAAD